jgi:hypothetical protein
MSEVTTPDGRPLVRGLCTCAMHCTNSPYHERACCGGGWCDCWCHAKEYAARAAKPASRVAPVRGAMEAGESDGSSVEE